MELEDQTTELMFCTEIRGYYKTQTYLLESENLIKDHKLLRKTNQTFFMSCKIFSRTVHCVSNTLSCNVCFLFLESLK